MGDLTPPSPCTGVCLLGADDVCTGCLRTLDEIAAWAAMAPDRKRAVIAAAAVRRAQPAAISASSIATARR